MTRRYAFVVPRYGAEIVGGAETLAGAIARECARRGDEITVLTTCARDNRSWENHYAPGCTVEQGVTVHRFPVDDRNLDVWIPIQIAISEGLRPSLDDQLEWMAQSVNARELYAHIARHSSNYDALFFAPYLFGTTFWGALIDPSRSFLIPCLHDEHYAYLEVIASLFRQVRGALFNAAPEMDLARALYGDIRGGDVGMGFDFSRFDQVNQNPRPYFDDTFRYLLYAGRKETGKNVQVLIDYFIEGKESGAIEPDIRLVIVGGGSFDDLHRPQALLRQDIIDIMQVSEAEKLALMKHALALCQLSTNESFSIVIMESWALGVPVIVHGECAVTRHHALQSGGGLPIRSGEEFSGAVSELSGNAELCSALGIAGDRYVRREYCWHAVLERLDDVMDSFSPGTEAVPAKSASREES